MTVIVTAHAVVRFIERVYGIDLDSFRREAKEALGVDSLTDAQLVNWLRKQGINLSMFYEEIRSITTPAIEAKADSLLHCGCRYHLNGSTVVTVMTEGPRIKRSRPIVRRKYRSMNRHQQRAAG